MPSTVANLMPVALARIATGVYASGRMAGRKNRVVATMALMKIAQKDGQCE